MYIENWTRNEIIVEELWGRGSTITLVLGLERYALMRKLYPPPANIAFCNPDGQILLPSDGFAALLDRLPREQFLTLPSPQAPGRVVQVLGQSWLISSQAIQYASMLSTPGMLALGATPAPMRLAR